MTSTQVRIVSWKEGLKKISLSKLIRQYSNSSLGEAHNKVETLLQGNTVVIKVANRKEGERFIREAYDLGAICEL